MEDDEIDDAQLQQHILNEMEEIPEKFRHQEFNPIPTIVEVLQADDPEQKTEDIEEYFNKMETAMYSIVDGKTKTKKMLLEKLNIN